MEWYNIRKKQEACSIGLGNITMSVGLGKGAKTA